MGQALKPKVEALEVDQSGGLVVGLRPQDTYHGQRYVALNSNRFQADESHTRSSNTISPLSKAI